MNEKKYVQYKNDPNGTKWEVMYDYPNNKYISITDGEDLYHVPRRDYIPCAPPERWTDITEQCEATYKTLTGPSAAWNVSLKMPNKNENYTFRLRKVQLLKGCYDDTSYPGDPTVQQWAFIVEKRED